MFPKNFGRRGTGFFIDKLPCSLALQL